MNFFRPPGLTRGSRTGDMLNREKVPPHPPETGRENPAAEKEEKRKEKNEFESDAPP